MSGGARCIFGPRRIPIKRDEIRFRGKETRHWTSFSSKFATTVDLFDCDTNNNQIQFIQGVTKKSASIPLAIVLINYNNFSK
jgi:hypothetical protein